jgi:hypothetical protein
MKIFFLSALFFLKSFILGNVYADEDDVERDGQTRPRPLLEEEKPFFLYMDEDEIEELKKQQIPPYTRPQITSIILKTPIDLAWKALQKALRPYGVSEIKEKLYFIKTRFHDDTLEQDFLEEDFVLWTTQFQLLASLKEVGKNNQLATQVFIYQKRRVLPPPAFLNEEEVNQLKDGKRSFIWKAFPTDGIKEHVIIYRLKRLISLYQIIEQERKLIPLKVPSIKAPVRQVRVKKKGQLTGKNKKPSS